MASDDGLLGIPRTTATHRLRKLILFDFAQRLGLDQCFRCGQRIEGIDDLSIEHKEPWRSADKPTQAFFDLENIAFSHWGCNASVNAGGRRNGERCKRGHLLGEPDENGWRCCKECKREGNKRWRDRQRLARSRAE